VSLKEIPKNTMVIEIVCWSQFLLTLESNPKRSLSGRRHRYGIFQYIEQLANARTSSQILVRRSCIRRFSSFPPASNCRIRATSSNLPWRRIQGGSFFDRLRRTCPLGKICLRNKRTSLQPIEEVVQRPNHKFISQLLHEPYQDVQ